MNIFKLPDLGEGLPDAIIREWYIKEGEEVKKDQPLVAMETAKALVDVPAAFDGTIEKLFGAVDDTIETGHPLIGFVGEAQEEEVKDSTTVVGAIEQSDTVLEESVLLATNTQNNTQQRVRATPAVRALARRLQVDLQTISFQGERISINDIKQAAANQTSQASAKTTTNKNAKKLSPARHAMVLSMTQSHQQVVPVNLCDDANISAWDNQQDMSLRLIHAICYACQQVPILNSYFYPREMRFTTHKQVNLGIAVDSEHGLFVPVIKQAQQQSDKQLREVLEQFKQRAAEKSFPAEQLNDATIVLSNFGTIAGRYANPIIIPPTVAIIGVGRTYQKHYLPISITADHRLVTGGEIARFLKAMLEHLAKNKNVSS